MEKVAGAGSWLRKKVTAQHRAFAHEHFFLGEEDVAHASGQRRVAEEACVCSVLLIDEIECLAVVCY